jgi:predicted Zn-dependent protease
MNRKRLAALLMMLAVTPMVWGQESDAVKGLRKLIDTGHAEEALKLVAERRSAGGDTAGLDRMAGLALYAEDKLQAADQAFSLAVAKDGNDVESTEMLALTLVKLGRPKEAIPLLEGLKGKTGGEAGRKADPNYVLALCYIDTLRFEDARRAFAAQFGLAPESAPAYLLAARMLVRREYLPVAQGFAEKALVLQPGLPLAHALLGEIALAGNHLDVAIAEFEKEKASNPLEPSVYDRLGDAYGREGKYDEALSNLQEAVLLEPNATGPYILLGKTMLKQGDAVGAVTYLEHAERMDPANFMTHTMLGQGYRALGRPEEASRELATAQRLQTASEPKLKSVQ